MNSLSSGLLAPRMLLLNRSSRTRMDGLFDAAPQISQFSSSGVDVSLHGVTLAAVDTLRLDPWLGCGQEPGKLVTMQLRDVLPDWHIEWVEETGSTNHDLAAAARQGASTPRALIADHQHAGRGRFDRRWQAPPGTSLAVSVLIAPQVPLARWPWGSMLAALAVQDACTKAGAADVRLKWPNDVLTPGGKLCGILAERVQTQDADLLVIGMGINTSMSADQLPVPTATSLQLLGANPEPMPLVKDLLTTFNLLLARWNAGDSLIDEYRAQCSTIGRRVRVLRSTGQPVEGTAAKVTEDGQLLVATTAGFEAFSAGDVEHLR